MHRGGSSAGATSSGQSSVRRGTADSVAINNGEELDLLGFGSGAACGGCGGSENWTSLTVQEDWFRVLGLELLEESADSYDFATMP